MKNRIKITLPLAYAEQKDNPDIIHELNAVQDYFDSVDLGMDKETVYFVALRGEYTHIEGKMRVVGVLVNLSGDAIAAIKASIKLQTDLKSTQLAQVNISLPPDFFGVLNSDEGMLIRFTVPCRGIEKDTTLEAAQFISELVNIQVYPADDSNYHSII